MQRTARHNQRIELGSCSGQAESSASFHTQVPKLLGTQRPGCVSGHPDQGPTPWWRVSGPGTRTLSDPCPARQTQRAACTMMRKSSERRPAMHRASTESGYTPSRGDASEITRLHAHAGHGPGPTLEFAAQGLSPACARMKLEGCELTRLALSMTCCRTAAPNSKNLPSKPFSRPPPSATGRATTSSQLSDRSGLFGARRPCARKTSVKRGPSPSRGDMFFVRF